MTRYFELDDKVINSHTIAVPLVDLARQRGIHPDKLLKGTRLFSEDLLRGRARISHNQLLKLIMNAQKHLAVSDTSFLIGRRMFPANLGLVGNALMSGSNIADMLQVINRFQMQVLPSMFVQYRIFDGYHYLYFNPAVSIANDEQQIFLYEMITSAITCALKWRLGYIPSIAWLFPYAEPKYIEQYQVNLSNHCQFLPQAKTFGLQLKIHDELMHQPFADSNPTLKRHYLKQITQSYRTIGLLQHILLYMNKHQDVTLEQLSLWLNVSTATLKRKLSNHNTSFQKLYDLQRQQEAIFRLITIGHTNEMVAHALNFSDITNFRRSFKRWTGMTPNALKQQLKA